MVKFKKVNDELQTNAPNPSVNKKEPPYSFVGLRKVGGTFVHFENFSDGEKQLAQYKYGIYYAIKGLKDAIQPKVNKSWLCVDEPERSLHPEWARCFLRTYITAFDEVRKYIGETKEAWKRYSVFFATHSPFLLSDVTSDYVICLEKEKGRTVQKQLPNTFAGNIGELFSDSFFMDKTIGELASERIEEVVEHINSGKVLDDDRNLVNAVGDPLLKKLLQEMLDVKLQTKDKEESEEKDEEDSHRQE